jgi:hypothetical protein
MEGQGFMALAPGKLERQLGRAWLAPVRGRSGGWEENWTVIHGPWAHLQIMKSSCLPLLLTLNLPKQGMEKEFIT